jgi:hypothetical protein
MNGEFLKGSAASCAGGNSGLLDAAVLPVCGAKSIYEVIDPDAKYSAIGVWIG